MRLFLLVALFSIIVFGQDALITVPANPLTATGLASVYFNSLNQSIACNAAFAQATWFDPNQNLIFGYGPLIITIGTTAAVTPTPPVIGAGSTVGIWFGFNGATLTLVDNNNGANLAAGGCVNGITGSIFGQVAYCNAGPFYVAANAAINAGLLKVPPLGTANDGMACPTTRDFFVVDMDQSDNVVTSYLVTTTTQIAQATQTNINKLGTAVVTTLTNASDLRLLSIAMDSAMACTSWVIPDLTDPIIASTLPSYASVEMHAAAWQQAPIALTPLSHAMTRVNNQPSLVKTNAYRVGADQVQATSVTQADGTVYCSNLYFIGPRRLALNAAALSNFASADPAAAINLFAFLAQRYATSFGPDGLNCASLLGVPNPVVPIMNMGGLFVGATITVPNQTTTTTGLSTNNIIIVVVCTVVGGLLIIGLIIGAIWYRNRSMYS